ncbi:MAG: hypothetical protein NXI10_13290 [bacterium]|nr:hypothetical protein [bacterium]
MTLSTRLIIVGFAFILFFSIWAYFRALEDKKVDKSEMSLGFYIFRYPLLFIGVLTGFAFLVAGYLVR